MSFRFPLQKVLEHRGILEDLAQKDFQEAEFSLRQETQLLRHLEKMLAVSFVRASEVQTMGGDGAPESLKQIHEFQILQRRKIKDQMAKVEQAEKLVEAKREILRQKAIDHKIMKRLKERRWEEFRADQRDRERKESDEISVLRHRLKGEE